MSSTTDPFDTSSNPNLWTGLQNFGFATMAAGSQPGVTTLGALGQGGMAAMEAARQNTLAQAQRQNMQSETRSRNVSTNMQVQNANLMNSAFGLPQMDANGNMLPNNPASSAQNSGSSNSSANSPASAGSSNSAGNTTPPTNSAGMPYSPTPGSNVSSSATTRAVPTGNISVSSVAPSNSPFGNPRILDVATGRALPANAAEAAAAAPLAQRLGSPAAKNLAEYAYAQQTSAAEGWGKVAPSVAQAGGEAWAKAPAEAWTASMHPSDLRGPGSARIDPYQGTITQIPNEINVINPQTLAEEKKFVPLGTVTTPIGGGAAPAGASNMKLPQTPATAGGAQQSLAPNTGQAQTPAAGNEPSYMTKAPPGQEAIVKEAAENYAGKETQAYHASQAILGRVSTMQNLFGQLNQSGWSSTGAGAEARQNIAKTVNGLATSIGATSLPFDPNKIASAEDLNTETTKMGAELTQQYFGAAREAASTISRDTAAVPGVKNTLTGAMMNLEGMKEAANYQSDLYNFKTQWAQKNGGNLMGADAEFNKMNPPQAYSKRAISQFLPLRINKPGGLQNLLPGTVFLTPDGQRKVVPDSGMMGGQ